MEIGKHHYSGVYSTGNPLQPEGRHSEYHMDRGIGFIPLGNRNRVAATEIHLVGNAEESESVDRYSKYSG
jgi:hypothetical protein